jgi:sialic acid synthase SpsE
MTKIISEIGWNHMGDMDLAKEMISASKENGADMVKFQTWSLERLKDGPWDTDGRREIYEKAELTKDKHIELYEYSNKLNIPFFSSVFSVEDARLLVYVEKDKVKIASFESRNKELLSFCDGLFDTIYISTGTSTIDEIKESLEYIKTSNVVLLHCVSSYPLEPQNTNLPKINALKEICDRVGYSDHTTGVEVSKAALEYDIEVIEKHFTLDHDLPGRDNKFAILPHELKELSDYIKLRKEVNVNHGNGYLECEEEAREVMTGRFR